MAEKRVREQKKFYQHLTSYITTMLFLVAINWLSTPSYWWFVWPALGWGMGLVGHYFQAFGMPGGAGTAEWEEKQIAKEIAKLGGSPKSISKKSQKASFDVDEHLELRELESEKMADPETQYRREDLV